MHHGEVSMSDLGDASKERPAKQWRQIIDECVGKALANSFRQQILWIFNERVASPSDIAKELGAGLSKVCHHINVLKDAKCIELDHTKTIGNRVQSYYKANSRALLDELEWKKVPGSLKGGLRATLLANIIEDSTESVVEGIFDSREGSHLSWTPLIVDEQGRVELAQVLERALLEVIAIQDNTKERLGTRGVMGMSYTVSILGHPSTGGEKHVGPPTTAKDLAGPAKPKVASASKTKSKTKGTKAAAKGKARKGRSKSKQHKGAR
jgi:hypothetical protein